MGCAPDSQLLKFTLSYQATNHDCRHISQIKLPTSSSQSPSSCPQAVPSAYHELRAFPKRPFDIDGSKYIKDWEALKPDGNFQWNIFYLRKYQSAISKCFTDVLILIFIFLKRTKLKSFSIRLKQTVLAFDSKLFLTPFKILHYIILNKIKMVLSFISK